MGDEKSPFGDFFKDAAERAARSVKTAADQASPALKALGETAMQNARTLAEAAGRSAGELQNNESFIQARDKIREAAQGATQQAKNMSAIARRMIEMLNNAQVLVRDRDAFIQKTFETFLDINSQLDKKADAIAFGYLAEAGAGVAGITGLEILYHRGPQELRVSQLKGKAARLAIGASTNAYVACAYGDEDLLQEPAKRRGADLEVIIASLGFFQIQDPKAERRASGWLAGLGAGLSFGVPILSGATAFEFEETLIERLQLTDQEVHKLESALAGATDRSYRRNIARAL